jgi:hypothetical protein
MPWFLNPSEYTCDDCGERFFNPPAGLGAAEKDRSAVITFGANNNITRCTPCATTHNGNFLSPVENLGVRLSTTISYQIHNRGNFSFHGGPTLMAAMAGGTAGAMAAAGALNLMDHPAYPGGKIRSPNAFSGANLGNAALRAWPGAAGMNMHHVHVGQGINNRVLFGWSATAYPNNPAHVQSIKLYIGS